MDSIDKDCNLNLSIGRDLERSGRFSRFRRLSGWLDHVDAVYWEAQAVRAVIFIDYGFKVTNILWNRCVVSRGSLVIVVIRLPNSSINSADKLHTVSTAMDTNRCVVARSSYFTVSLTAASSAAAQVVVEVNWT